MIKFINSLDTGGQWETDYLLARKINEIIKYINDNEIKNNDYISKDKLREKIKKAKCYAWHNKDDQYWVNEIIESFEELLEVEDE